MAIQIPNPGTGNGASGDNEFVLWSKVKDNFSDQTNAASKLVGTGSGQIPLAKDTFTAQAASTASTLQPPSTGLMTAFPMGVKMTATNGGDYTDKPVKTAGTSDTWGYRTETMAGNAFSNFIFAYPYREGDIYFRKYNYGGTWSEWAKLYHSGNTTIVNGSLKPSSPVVKIHTDSLELNGDAERMGVTLNKRGVGDYLLQNTTGLRNDGGWRIELPQDVNGNPYFAVTYNELENNDIEVKTYKRIFDMNTFMFVPDLDNPVDIKEGRSIAIRFNDLPYEYLDDTQMEV